MYRRHTLRVVIVALLIAFACAPARAYQLKAPGGGAIRALVVGVNTYLNVPNSDLKGAVADAKGIASALVGGGVKDVTIFLNENATRARFVGAMDRLVDTSKPGDLAVISYAGHGLRVQEYETWKGIDPAGVNEEIALSGFGVKSPNFGEVVVNVEIRAWLSRLNAKGVDVVVVWDSCFGGGMRDVVPGGGVIRTRQLRAVPDEAIRKTFTGIPMTGLEARANVKAMEHVTFLAGADSSSVVPELSGMDRGDPGQAHGALSFYMSRALRGELAQGSVSRLKLFSGIRQGVREASRDQAIDLAPRSEDSAVSGRTVIVVDDVTPQPQPLESPLRLAIVDGPASAFESVMKGQTPLTLATDANDAELVWNVLTRQAIVHGDILMENIDASLIGAIADRVRSLTSLRALGQGRTLSVKAGEDGKAFVPPDHAEASVTGLAGAVVTVFNVAADGTIQMLLPAAPASRAQCPNADDSQWRCDLDITPPFGIDTVVAVATKEVPTELLTWLQRHHGQRAAADLPRLLKAMTQTDGGLRLGYAEVVTAPMK